MNDDKKELDDLDWEKALAEWESTTFVAEVARDSVTDRPAGLSGTQVSKPLYRPPSVPPPTRGTAPAVAQVTPPSPPASARPSDIAGRGVPRGFSAHDEDGEDDDATLIAAIPEELLRHDGTPPKGSGAGFGPIFSRSHETPAIRAPHPAPDPGIIEDAPSATSLGVEEVPDDEDPLEALGGPPSARPSRRTTETPGFGELDVALSIGASEAPDVSGDEDVFARPSRTFYDEKPAKAWLDPAAREGTEQRADWLEEEARALPDPIRRARALLSCSELRANLGDRERAHNLAADACAIAPSVALTHRQARALAPWPPDPEEFAEALDAEARASTSVAARVHSTLLAADALFAHGDDAGAIQRLAQAERLAPVDPRPVVARVARALAKGELDRDALSVGEGPSLDALREAIIVCRRLRPSGLARGDGEQPSLNELAREARAALDAGDLGLASALVAEIARVPELALAARWLAAALGATIRTHRRAAIRWLRELIERGEESARRPLLARALELGDTEVAAEAIDQPGLLTPAERVTLSALSGSPLVASDPNLDAAAAVAGLEALACAAAAVGSPPDQARAKRAPGSHSSRQQVELGRLMAALADEATLAHAVLSLDEAGPAAQGIRLEIAFRQGEHAEVARRLTEWLEIHEPVEGAGKTALLRAVLAERAHDMTEAVTAYRAVRAFDPASEVALRALASLEPVDLVSEMNAIADETEGHRSALARIEAVARGEAMLAEPTQAHLLERAFRAAPDLPFAPFLAERIAQRSGDVEDRIRWVRERARRTEDSVESALQAVREALLVADRDPPLAGARFGEAHLARPGDVALRQLYERFGNPPPQDRARWREGRAAEGEGEPRVLFALEASHEYERAGDEEGAFRCAVVAASSQASLGLVALERAELATGRVARLTDEILAETKAAGTQKARREGHERLALLDRETRRDTASALDRHRAILEEQPDSKRSLRYLEHDALSEGRSTELGPALARIAACLGESPEGAAHAELSVRSQLQDAARALPALELTRASLRGEPSLWALRSLESLARRANDDAALLDTWLLLAERASRAPETAALLVRASEAATRLERLVEARSLLERACMEDAGDVSAFARLAELCRRSADARGLAEALEALARASHVRDHELKAWGDAGRVWQGEVRDDARALSALETAAALDVSYDDVFDRLSRIYAVRGMQTELADLLERRIQLVTDPEERRAIEVRRGRILLEVGETVGARRAFQAALDGNPDDIDALSAMADLSLASSEWQDAENALVRLTRLAQTPDAQRVVYASLADLYSTHRLNLARAEVALKEVLKRAPGDAPTAEKLVEIYRRQNDSARAVEVQQELVARATTPEEKRRRTLELAALLEAAARDPRRAEKVLEAARRELPFDAALLAALVNLYARHQQTPAVNVILDRAVNEARGAIADGRLTAEPFEVIAASHDLRGRAASARVVRTVHAAIEGKPATLGGANERALDPALDDLVAPADISPSVRGLLALTGGALEAAYPFDTRTAMGAPLSDRAPLAEMASRYAAAAGAGAVNLVVSTGLSDPCLVVSSRPLVLAIADDLARVCEETAAPGAFFVVRAIKLALANVAAFTRVLPEELSAVVAGWVKCFHPNWEPEALAESAVEDAAARIGVSLRKDRNAPDHAEALAVDVAAAIDRGRAQLGARALEWGNRVALVALGDPGAAFDALALAAGAKAAADEQPSRARFVAGSPEARDLVEFCVSDAFAHARRLLDLDG